MVISSILEPVGRPTKCCKLPLSLPPLHEPRHSPPRSSFSEPNGQKIIVAAIRKLEASCPINDQTDSVEVDIVGAIDAEVHSEGVSSGFSDSCEWHGKPCRLHSDGFGVR